MNIVAIREVPAPRNGDASNRHLGRELLMQKYAACLAARVTAGGLRPILASLLQFGADRQELIRVAVNAGYSKGYISSLMSRILCLTGHRLRQSGPGRSLSKRARELLELVLRDDGEPGIKYLLSAYRAGLTRMATRRLREQAAAVITSLNLPIAQSAIFVSQKQMPAPSTNGERTPRPPVPSQEQAPLTNQLSTIASNTL